ncbi:MAG: DUF6880 family protein [Sphingomonas sp.]
MIGWGLGGKLHADQAETGHRLRTAKFVLQEIAKAIGDVDAYIAQFDPVAHTGPAIAADIARRASDRMGAGADRRALPRGGWTEDARAFRR